MEIQIDRVTAMRLAAEERARVAAIPPATLESVVQAGDIASFVGVEAWATAQGIAKEIDTVRANLRLIVEKLEETSLAQFERGMRRVVDVNRMAEEALKGQVPQEDPPVTPQGLAALSGQALADLKSGLDQKQREATDRISWLEGRLKAAVKDVCRLAMENIATKYGALLAEARQLRPLLDGGEQICRDIIAGDWRRETWLAPRVGKMDRFPGPAFSGSHYLADFSTGAGLVGAVEGWKKAVKAATGADLG